MTITYHKNLVQGSEEWHSIRRGLLTASEMDNVINKKLSLVNKGEISSHHYEILSQRISGFVEPHYISDDMLRGHEDEIYMRDIYTKTYAPVEEVGFITNDKWGFTIGYSPDGLVGDDGLIEGKSRRQKYQVETILSQAMPDDFKIQVQTGLLVSERKWCDFNTYCGGHFMYTLRVYPDLAAQAAILDAASLFERNLAQMMAKYDTIIATGSKLIKTERRIETDIIIGEKNG